MLGELVSIQAEIEIIHNLSAHADYVEILNWLGNFKRAPKTVFINHGEQNAKSSFKKKIEERFGWHCELPQYLQRFNL